VTKDEAIIYATADDFQRDCINIYGYVLTGKLKHYCPYWDFMPIDETCEEIGGCKCYVPDKGEVK